MNYPFKKFSPRCWNHTNAVRLVRPTPQIDNVSPCPRQKTVGALVKAKPRVHLKRQHTIVCRPCRSKKQSTPMFSSKNKRGANRFVGPTSHTKLQSLPRSQGQIRTEEVPSQATTTNVAALQCRPTEQANRKRKREESSAWSHHGSLYVRPNCQKSKIQVVLEHPNLDSPFRLDNEHTRKALDRPSYPKSEKNAGRSLAFFDTW